LGEVSVVRRSVRAWKWLRLWCLWGEGRRDCRWLDDLRSGSTPQGTTPAERIGWLRVAVLAADCESRSEGEIDAGLVMLTASFNRTTIACQVKSKVLRFNCEPSGIALILNHI
jgi:hypothetical protein